MPQSLQSIYSFDKEGIFANKIFSPFLSWSKRKFSLGSSVFVDCDIKRIMLVSHRIWHILHLFFNMFLFQTVVITMTTTTTTMMMMMMMIMMMI